MEELQLPVVNKNGGGPNTVVFLTKSQPYWNNIVYRYRIETQTLNPSLSLVTYCLMSGLNSKLSLICK